MRRNPETKVLLEQALRHVLAEQSKLLGNSAYGKLPDIIKLLNELAAKTAALTAEGLPGKSEIKTLTTLARKVEKKTDDLSKKLWHPLLISVSAIYERIEESFDRKEGQARLREDTKAFYHDMRIRLLEQTIGARGLINNNDLGDENERIWLQFLERELGSMFRVVRGGLIRDHAGNESGQIDIIVVPSDAQVMAVTDAKGGKAMVYIDQVISVIMVGSTLTKEKLREDWMALQKIPDFTEKEKDHAHLKGHTWPLCYIVSSQSDEAKRLTEEWGNLCAGGHLKHVPQLVVMLDSGFMYGGRNALSWPHPHTNSFDTEAGNVGMQSGLHAGLGLGWLLIQHQGRLAAIHRRALGHVVRQATQLQNATMTSAAPPTLSRFCKLLSMHPIEGVVEWGSYGYHVHNRLYCETIFILKSDTERQYLKIDGAEPEPDDYNAKLKWTEKNLRRFKRDASTPSIIGKWIFAEELLNRESKAQYTSRVVVFNTETGEEIISDAINRLKDIPKSEDELAVLALPE